MSNSTKEQKKILDSIQNIEKRLNVIELNNTSNHSHDGINSKNVIFSNIYGKKVWINHTIQGTGAATAANYGVFFIIPWSCTVKKIQEVHNVAGDDAGAVTLNIERLTTTEGPDGGDSILGTGLSLKATANVIQTGTLTETGDNLKLAIGDRLCMADLGNLTTIDTTTVMVELQISQDAV